MPKFTTIAVPIYANPKTFPASKLEKVKKDLKNYLTKDAGPMLRRDMEATVSGWKHKPTMVMEYSEPWGAHMQIRIYPKGSGTLNWNRISEGTGPRAIYAKPGSMMVFPESYMPKTTPDGRYGGPGRKYGPIRKAKRVWHSIEPRKFTTIIKAKREDKIQSDIRAVIWNARGF